MSVYLPQLPPQVGQAGPDLCRGGDGDFASKAADPPQKGVADANGGREMEAAVGLVKQDQLPAEAVEHGFPQVGGAAQGDPVLRPAVHLKVLFQIGRQVEAVQQLFAAAGLVLQHLHLAHPVHPVVADARGDVVVLVGDQVIAAVVPGHAPGADGVVLAVGVMEGDLPAGVDGLVQGVDAVKDAGVLAAGEARHVDLALQLGRLIAAGQPL